MEIKVYTIKLNPPRWVRNLIVYVALPVGVLVGAAVAVRAGVGLTTFAAGTAIKADEVNANFSALDARLASLEDAPPPPGLLKPTAFFNWSLVVATASAVETRTSEGMQTITFPVAGYYRVTLDAQVIHDGASFLVWYLGGNAKRVDPYSQEAGGKDIKIYQSAPDTRQVESTVLFISATAGQQLTIDPALTVTYSSGNYHEATFMYAAEYLGPP